MNTGESAVGAGTMEACQFQKGTTCTRFAIEVTGEDCRNCRDTNWFVPQMTAHREYRRVTGSTDGLPIRCTRFGLRVDREFCSECLQNGYLRQLLADRRRRARQHKYVCRHLSTGPAGMAERPCCGGKMKSFLAFPCTHRAENVVPDYDCAECPDYGPPGFDMALLDGADDASPCPPAASG